MIPIPMDHYLSNWKGGYVRFSNDAESVKILMGIIITPQEDKWEIGERREEKGERGVGENKLRDSRLAPTIYHLRPMIITMVVFMMLMIDGGDFDQHDWFPYKKKPIHKWKCQSHFLELCDDIDFWLK